MLSAYAIALATRSLSCCFASDQAATILPYLLVAPRLFAEDPADVLTLGVLTQTANAFGKVLE